MNRTLSILILATLTVIFTAEAFADVKVKSKQSVGGQSYESTTYIKGKRQRSETMGGMVTVTQCDLRRGVQINTNSKTYMVNPFATSVQTTVRTKDSGLDKEGVVHTGGRVTTTITTKDTGERKQMFGYTARRLIITIETLSSPDACSKSDTKMQTDGWYIDAAFALDCDGGHGGFGSSNARSGGCQDKYEVKTVGTAKRGFAVYEKTSILDGNGRETYAMINEVVEFSNATLDASLFDVPSGFREVNDASQMYAAISTQPEPLSASSGSSGSIPAATVAKVSAEPATQLMPKKAGTIRIGVTNVKTGAVGDSISPADLAAAVQSALGKYLNAPNVEVVPIQAVVPSAISAEATGKDCDFTAFLTASHKKGSGGFGMFKSLAPMISNAVPLGGNSGTYSGNASSPTAITAPSVSARVKNKDEFTLDLRLDLPAGAALLERSIKVKARANGEDIISPAVEQAAKAIVEALKNNR